jgi:hypothetical protein
MMSIKSLWLGLTASLPISIASNVFAQQPCDYVRWGMNLCIMRGWGMGWFISLEGISLKAILEQFIDEISAFSWLALESQGAIFLVGEKPEVLEMKAQRALLKSYILKAYFP